MYTVKDVERWLSICQCYHEWEDLAINEEIDYDDFFRQHFPDEEKVIDPFTCTTDKDEMPYEVREIISIYNSTGRPIEEIISAYNAVPSWLREALEEIGYESF